MLQEASSETVAFQSIGFTDGLRQELLFERGSQPGNGSKDDHGDKNDYVSNHSKDIDGITFTENYANMALLSDTNSQARKDDKDDDASISSNDLDGVTFADDLANMDLLSDTDSQAGNYDKDKHASLYKKDLDGPNFNEHVDFGKIPINTHTLFQIRSHPHHRRHVQIENLSRRLIKQSWRGELSTSRHA